MAACKLTTTLKQGQMENKKYVHKEKGRRYRMYIVASANAEIVTYGGKLTRIKNRKRGG